MLVDPATLVIKNKKIEIKFSIKTTGCHDIRVSDVMSEYLTTLHGSEFEALENHKVILMKCISNYLIQPRVVAACFSSRIRPFVN